LVGAGSITVERHHHVHPYFAHDSPTLTPSVVKVPSNQNSLELQESVAIGQTRTGLGAGMTQAWMQVSVRLSETATIAQMPAHLVADGHRTERHSLGSAGSTAGPISPARSREY